MTDTGLPTFVLIDTSALTPDFALFHPGELAFGRVAGGIRIALKCCSSALSFPGRARTPKRKS
jgi:hypothetical protein